jgi:hypothetical protein
MINRIFRRRRAMSATPLRVALHGTAVSLSSVGFGYGTTFIGADGPSAAGLGLSAFTVLLALFPLPSTKNGEPSAVLSEAPERTSGTEEEAEDADSDVLPGGPRSSSFTGTVDSTKLAPTSDEEKLMLPAIGTESPRPAVGVKPAFDDEKPTLPTIGTADSKGTSPVNSAQPEPDVPVLVWEPRLEIKIKPQVTVHPAVFKDATGAVSAVPAAEPDGGLMRSDEAS